MKLKSLLGALSVASVLAFAGMAQADTTGSMPVLYNSSGQAVNLTGVPFPAGTYYLGINKTQPVTYFGDGSFYNPATNMYGGSVFNPTGKVGTYVIPAQGEMPDPSTIGLPNTGLGGMAASLWTTLSLSGLVALAGSLYLARTRHALSR